MKSVQIFTLLAGILLISACGIHRIDIQQGNMITDEMVAKLKIGMNKHQVKFVLGTPLVISPFDPDRWEYIYSLRKRLGKTTQKRLTLYFKNDTLTKVDGDFKIAGK